NAGLAPRASEAGSIADQAAELDELAPLIDRRNGMPRSKRHELFASAEEERIGADNERSGFPLDELIKDSLEFAFGASLQNIKLQPLCVRRFLMARSTFGLCGFRRRAIMLAWEPARQAARTA